MNDSTKKLVNEIRRKELQWNSEKAIYQQKIDQLQTKCKSLQERLEGQHKACRILIDSIRQINENDSLNQLNKIESSLDEIKNFNSSQRQMIKGYIQDLMALAQRQSSIQSEKNKTKILTVDHYKIQDNQENLTTQSNCSLQDKDLTIFQMLCWNCQKILDSNRELFMAQKNFTQENQFKKKKDVQRIDLDNSKSKVEQKLQQKNELNENFSPTKFKQRSYSIHSGDSESESSNQKSQIESIDDQSQVVLNKEVENDLETIQEINKENDQNTKPENDKENLYDKKENNFEHKRVNSDSVFLSKNIIENQNCVNKGKEILTPQFDLQKQTNLQENTKLKSNRNLMAEFVSEMFNSQNLSENQKQNNQNNLRDQSVDQIHQQEALERSQDIQQSNIAFLKQNENKNKNNNVISFSNIDQIQQEIQNEKVNPLKASIEEVAEQEQNSKNESFSQQNKKQENELEKSEYPFFNLKNFQQELFGKKESLNNSAQLKTLLSQTSRNYSNAKQPKKTEKQIQKQFTKNSFLENQNPKRLSHSSEFEQNKISQNLFTQGPLITKHKVNKKFDFQHKKSEGNIPKFNNQKDLLKRLNTEECDYFDVKLDYELIQRNLNLFQSPEKNKQNQTQVSIVYSNAKNKDSKSPQNLQLQKNNTKEIPRRKSNNKNENGMKFQNQILGLNKQKTSRDKQKKKTSQERLQPYIQYKNNFQPPRYSCKKSFKENQKFLMLQKSNFDKLIPQRSTNNKSSPKYKSFYKKIKTKKNERSFKQKTKKDENFDIKIIRTELIKIPTTIKRVTLKRMKSRNNSPNQVIKKKQPKDSLKELQSALNSKFFEINSKIYQLILSLIMRTLFLLLLIKIAMQCPGIRYCRQCSIFEQNQICSNCESSVYNFQKHQCEEPTFPKQNCIRYNNDPNNHCLECEDGYRLKQDGTCEQCSIENCAVCSQKADVCESCFKGLAVEDNLCKDKQCDLSYCEICDSSQSTCLKCQNHYSLNQSFCEPGLDNCIQVQKSNKQKCELCEVGHFLNEEYFCQPNDTQSYKVYFLIFFFLVLILFVSMLLYHKVLKKEQPEETYLSIENQLSYNKHK